MLKSLFRAGSSIYRRRFLSDASPNSSDTFSWVKDLLSANKVIGAILVTGGFIYGFVRAEFAAKLDSMKSDITAVKADLKSDITTVKADLKSDINASEQRVKSDLKGDITAVKADLKSDINASEQRVKSDLKGDITALKADLKSDINASEQRVKSDLKASERRIFRKIDEVFSGKK